MWYHAACVMDSRLEYVKCEGGYIEGKGQWVQGTKGVREHVGFRDTSILIKNECDKYNIQYNTIEFAFVISDFLTL